MQAAAAGAGQAVRFDDFFDARQVLGQCTTVGGGECVKLCVSDLAHAVFRYGQASNRPANIMAS